jgi:hypothetical protein
MGIEVVSVIRLVSCLRPLSVDQITDPLLVAAVQHTLELDAVNVPLNKKTQKEAQTWLEVLRRQAIIESVLRLFAVEVREPHEQGARAKRAVAALAYVSGEPMNAIETMIQRHGGGFGGSAGNIRSIAARTSDMIGTAGRIAELLHPGLHLGERIERLQIRLTLGIPGAAVDLGREAGQQLSRGDYLALTLAGLTTPDAIQKASDEQILACLENDREQLAVVRSAARRMEARQRSADDTIPDLAPYAA